MNRRRSRRSEGRTREAVAAKAGRPPGGSRRLPPRLALALGVAALAVAVGVGFVAGGNFGGGGRTPSSSAGDAPATHLRLVPRAGSGPPAPSFRLKELRGERVITDADFAGTPLVLNFWASWCPFCIEEMPGFEAVHQRFGEAVAFLGVDLQDDPRLAAELVRRTGVTYPLAEDPDGAFYADVGGLGMPTTLFITADGRVARKVTGPLEADELERLVLEVLVKRAP